MVQEHIPHSCSILAGMADLVECWDRMLGQHCRRTGIYVEMLAVKMRKMGLYTESLTADYVELLKTGACMHEIGGLVSVAGVVREENGSPGFCGYRNKCVRASETLVRKNVGYLNNELLAGTIWEMAAFQAEKWDGTGFPEGRKGKEIPLSARILAVADYFDRLTEEEPGEQGIMPGRALEQMEKERGKSLDPEILDAFFALQEERSISEAMIFENII